MQSTTGPVGGSRARVIYHTPGKSFAWLHKDGSFADFQKALRLRLNISKNEPLVIKQIDGDYTLDIETEEEYEAFCHFAKSAPQLHISVNEGLRDLPKAGEVTANSSSTNVPAVLPLNPAESEDPTLGKRKASQITTDSEAVPSVGQKQEKRRKVGRNRSTSTVNTSAITGEPPEQEAEQEVVPGDAARDTPAVADADRPGVSQTQKKKKRKHPGAGSDSTSVDPVERRVDPSTELTGPSKPPPAESSKTNKRRTVVLDLSTVIPSPVATQEPPSTSNAQPPSPAAGPSSSTTKEVTKKPPAKKRAKTPVGPSEPSPATPPVLRPNAVNEPVSSSATTKPKPPVSKSGLPRPQVYVEIITKKRKTGKTGSSSVTEKETKQQEPVKKPAQQAVGKPKGNPKKSKTAERIDSPNALNIQEIMDGVIAAAMEDAKKRASSGGTGTDVSESFTPPPQKKFESTVREPRLVDASSLEPASSATLLDATQTTVDSDSIAVRTKVRTRKSRKEAAPFLIDSDSSSMAPNAHRGVDGDSPTLTPLLKKGGKSSTPLTAPPPNQKAMKKPLLAEKQPEEESISSEDEDSTPKKKPAPISDPNDELDAFLHAPAHPSQRSVLEELPSDSEDEEEEVEREDMEVDEEDEDPKSKLSRRGQLKVKVMARAGGSSDDDSDSESVDDDVLVNASQVKASTQVTYVSETQDVVPYPDLEDKREPLPQPTESTKTPTDAVAPVSSTSDSSEPRMTPISNLKSTGQALSFFNERVLDKPDPIENDSSHAMPPNDLPEDTEDPIENADATSTPKPRFVQHRKGRNKTASPIAARKTGAGFKSIQSRLTSFPNSMLPPPTPLQIIMGDLTFSQPLDQSTPTVPGVSRKKQLMSQATVPETPAHSTWTTLPQREESTQSMDDPVMVDELISSPTETAAKLPKVTPMKKPVSPGPTKQTPLFLPGTSRYPIPSSDLPAAEKSSSEEEDEEEDEGKTIASPSSRVLRPGATKNKTMTPYRSLSALASQQSIFPSTPIGPPGPAPIHKPQAKLGSEDDDDDDDDEEDSGVSDSDSPPSHIPKGRRAGSGSGSHGKRRSQLAMWS